MATYKDMQDRIADELIRSDLTSQIQKSINSAVDHYETWHFYFNEKRDTFNTSDGTEYYDIPDDLLVLNTLNVTITDRQYPLTRRTWQYIEDISWGGKTWQGYPEDYAIFGEQYRFYPIPNGSYEVEQSYLYTLGDLSNDSDSNAWTNDAEELIRCRAKWDLYTHVIMDPQQAQIMKAAELDALKQLKNHSNRYLMSGRVRPTQW